MHAIFLMKEIYNNYSMSPRWIWSDKITNERVAILKPGFAANFYFHNFTKRPERAYNYFPYVVKLRLLLAHSRSFSANQKARNALVGAENLLNIFSKFSAPTRAFLAFWLAKKLRLWANSRSFTSYGKFVWKIVVCSFWTLCKIVEIKIGGKTRFENSGSQRGLGLQGSGLKNAGLQDENFRALGLHIICFRAPGSTVIYNLDM